jgi:hypothetical protein
VIRGLFLNRGANIGGAVYGSVLVASIVVAAAGDDQLGLWKMSVIVAATSAVFWLAHVYAHTMGETLEHRQRITVAAVREVSKREWPLIQAAVLPLLALVLGALHVLERKTALWIAALLPIATLFAWGIVYARREQMGVWGTLAVASITSTFGIVVIALKIGVGH